MSTTNKAGTVAVVISPEVSPTHRVGWIDLRAPVAEGEELKEFPLTTCESYEEAEAVHDNLLELFDEDVELDASDRPAVERAYAQRFPSDRPNA